MNRFLLIRFYVEEKESTATGAEKLSAESACRHSLCIKSIDGIRGNPVGDSAFQLPCIIEKSSEFIEVCLRCENLLRVIDERQHLKELCLLIDKCFLCCLLDIGGKSRKSGKEEHQVIV